MATGQIISIHALLAESDTSPKSVIYLLDISIHALLAESDTDIRPPNLSSISISIHALLAESDLYSSSSSTPAVHFYPRSPCGERRVTVLGIQHKVGISIHALLAESDAMWFIIGCPMLKFLSTLSLRRATQHGNADDMCRYISIHALLAESDHYDNYNLHCVEISIHALLAESDYCSFYAQNRHLAFLSTLSLRRATNGHD